MTKRTGILPVILILFLTSCSMLPDWLGDTPAPKLEGERISVFKLESALKPDQNLEKLQVVLPPVGSAEHQALTGDLSHVTHFDIGEGAAYGLVAAPLVGENAVYTLDTKGNVAAYEMASGNKKLWHSNVSPEKGKQFAGGGLASTGDVLFVTMGSDEVVALNAKDGKEIWRRQVGNIVRAAALAAGGGVFVITIDNHLYAMDARDGRIVWTHAGAAESLGVFGAASPVATAKLLVAPYSSGEIYGLNPSTGEEVWVGNLGYNAMETAGTALNDIDVTPVVSNGVLYAAGNAGVLYAVNADSSKRLWHQELGSIRGIWPAGEFLYVVGGTNEVVCLQASTGNIRWVAQLPRYTDEAAKKGKIIISGPVLAGEKLLVSASNGALFLLSPYDGKIVHETKVPEGVLQSPVVSGGNVYVLSNKAILAVVQ